MDIEDTGKTGAPVGNVSPLLPDIHWCFFMAIMFTHSKTWRPLLPDELPIDSSKTAPT